MNYQFTIVPGSADHGYTCDACDGKNSTERGLKIEDTDTIYFLCAVCLAKFAKAAG